MLAVLDKDWFRGLLIALMLIGIGLALLGVQQFVDASVRLENNPAYKSQNSDEAISLKSQTQAQMLMAAGIEFRRLSFQRDNALMFGGAGFITLAVGWMGYDWLRSRRRKLNALQTISATRKG